MKLTPRHVKLNGDYFRIDEDADVPFRRIADSVMAPRQDISGVPGAINLQRDVWLWSMSDFVGGEGRQVFDSADPVGPPTFFKSDGGIDVRVRGEFSLHPDERLVSNTTGGGSVPTVTQWENTDLSTLFGAPVFSAGFSADAVRLGHGEAVQSPTRTPGAGPVIQVNCRFIQTRATKTNKKIAVQFRIRNMTDSTNVGAAQANLSDGESVTLSLNYTPAAGKTYRYWAEQVDSLDGGTVDVRRIREESYGTAPASSQDIRDLALGINEDVWALQFDGTNTDVLVWNFGSGEWDQAVANMVNSPPRAMTGSDQFMYSLHANGEVWKFNGSAALQYTEEPTTAGFDGDHGEPLGITVANNRIFVLYQQGLFVLTADLAASGPSWTLPLTDGDDYIRVARPGEFFSELTPDTTLRQHITSISGGVRFFVNVRGEQSIIYEFEGSDETATLTPTHSLPTGYIITAIKHYANITFIAAEFSNKASLPAEKRSGLFFLSSDDLLRFLGYLRFTDTNSMPVAYIGSYGHDVYMLQGRRLWRYNTGIGGITLENEVSVADETTVRAMTRMDKKFWVAVEGQGTFVADDSYPTQTMWMTSPLWNYDTPDMQKVLDSFDVTTRPLPSNCHVVVEYSLDEGDFVQAGVITAAGTVDSHFQISDVDETIKFTTLQWRVGLTSLDGVDTPRVLDITASGRVIRYEHSFDLTLLCEDDSPDWRLISEHSTGRKKLQAIWATEALGNYVEFVDHFSSSKDGDADTYTVVIEDPFQETSEQGQSSVRMKLKVVNDG